ncbi:MAG TPA: hypothetical protein VFK88_09945 [Gallionella sp.]|nr:hypothetical protein [Gallionella sp.]
MNRTSQIVAILSFVLYTSSALAMATCAPSGQITCSAQGDVALQVLDEIPVAAGNNESRDETAAGYWENVRDVSSTRAIQNNMLSFLNATPPETGDKSSNSVDGFGALLILTSDQDWEAKWNTPADVMPNFTRAHSVRRSGALTLLILFANPKADQHNSINVLCDIKATRPDGSISVNEANLVALKGELKGRPENVRLADPVIKFVGEPKDPLGEWIIEVTVKDMVRGVSVPIKTSFILEE